MDKKETHLVGHIEVAALLNSSSVRPAARPISGSFEGPKMMRAMTKIRINPGMPIFENMSVPPYCEISSKLPEIGRAAGRTLLEFKSAAKTLVSNEEPDKQTAEKDKTAG